MNSFNAKAFWWQVMCLFCLPVFLFPQSQNVKQLWLDDAWLKNEQFKEWFTADVLQDSKGLMWFATDEGLIQFNGAYYTTYRHDPNNPNSLGSSALRTLVEDKEGKIWISTHGNGVSVLHPETEQFVNYRRRPSGKSSLSNNLINCLMMSWDGAIWLGTEGGGWCRFNTGKNDFDCFQDDARFNYVKHIAQENDTTLWIGAGGGLLKLNPLTMQHREVQFFDEGGEKTRLSGQKILVTQNGEIWLYSGNRKLYRLKSRSNNHPDQYLARHVDALGGYYLSGLKQAKNGEIWALGMEGFLALNPNDGSIIPLQLNGMGPDLNLNEVWAYSLFEDNRGALWIPSEKGLLKWAQAQEKPFENYSRFPIPDLAAGRPLGLPAVYSIEKLDGHRLLVGDNHGLFIFNTLERSLLPASQFFSTLAEFDGKRVTCLFRDSRSHFWIVAFDKTYNLFRFEPKTNRLFPYGHLNTGSKQEIVETRQGALWIGSWTGLIHFDPEEGLKKVYRRQEEDSSGLSSSQVLSLLLENDSLLWIGTDGGGLNCLNLQTEEIRSYQYNPNDRSSISNDRVVDLFLDTDKELWVATDGGGLCRFVREEDVFERFLDGPGKPTLNFCAILAGEDGNLWASTKEGVSKFNKNTRTFTHYGGGTGLPPSDGIYNTKYKDEEGCLYFGSIHGFTRFLPSAIKPDTVMPRIVLTEFSLFNDKQLPGLAGSPLQKPIGSTEAIVLKHNQNFFAFKFSALHFVQPEKNQYAYRMKELIDDWQFLGNKHEVGFTNLHPGKYTLQVKGANHDGVWNEQGVSLQITILPPWYRTWWAYTFWALLISGTIYAIYRFQLNRQLTLAEAQHFKALDQAKSRLYTNITHEFRTPLTIILGMADQVKNDPKNWFNEGLKLIRRNGRQLLHLVNQLLDLSKLESGHIPLRLEQADVVNYLNYLAEPFHSYADARDIRLHFLTELKIFTMDFDSEKLRKVVSNLLSNAIKFTPEGGDIYLQLIVEKPGQDGEQLVLTVKDNGVGIPPEILPHIFDRFYQAPSQPPPKEEESLPEPAFSSPPSANPTPSGGLEGAGSGIGLALTKELVTLMKGTITVESEVGKGTKFTIRLPVSRQAPAASPSPETRAPAEEPAFFNADRTAAHSHQLESDSSQEGHESPLLLLIEDNADVVTYLTSFLSGNYRIALAPDGQAGIEKAIELVPDLIVSDVMMPEKDGFEVCATVKTDERTSHIPVILLTAKAGERSKIEGLGQGADAYIAKPFNREELMVRIEKLIDGRRRIQEQYAKNGYLRKKAGSNPPSLDDVFLEKIIKIIEENLSDENFGLPELCRKATTSRSQLFRKLKALTGKSTTHFIRSVRLEKARELLETTTLSISEVSYQTGFINPNYFSRSFRQEFGMSPSEVRKG